MRADRLLSALLLLQAHGRLTGRELAKRLEVSERTMHRDMEALSASGVPVFAMRGSRGGWQLEEGWRTQVPGFDEAELRAFLMAQPQVVGDQRLVHAAERALAKLIAAMPMPLRERAASIRQRLHVDTSRWYGTIENLSMLPVVQDAVSRDRKLQIVYKREGHEASERTVDPLGLVAKGTAWYLVANTPRGFRTYRVSRIKEATLLEQACERPPDFDLAAYWKASTEQFRDRTRYTAMLRLEANTAEMMKTWGCVSSADATESIHPTGWVTVQAQFDDEDHACFLVLGLGPRAEVLTPAKLRERVDADIGRIVARRTANVDLENGS
ncbi:MAG TPA: YafY family protein [Terriglobia bacterium]|nr:YafY family protein [Terriglobia bacterium]